MKENEVISEALRRLPRDVFYERQYRLARAINYSANKSVLSESEWTKADDVRCFFAFLNFLSFGIFIIYYTFNMKDVQYLKPFIAQVLAEAKEKDDWNSGKLE